MKKKILFLCTGNTCRSAMAAYLGAAMAEKQYGDIIQPFTNVFLFFHFKHLVTLIPQKKSLFHT